MPIQFDTFILSLLVAQARGLPQAEAARAAVVPAIAAPSKATALVMSMVLADRELESAKPIPAPGPGAPKSDEVNITKVTGETLDRARELLRQLRERRFKLTVRQETSATIAKDRVIQQSLTGPCILPDGFELVLTVSSGPPELREIEKPSDTKNVEPP